MFDQSQPNFTTMGGYAFNGMQQPVTKINNILTAEEIKELQQTTSQFSLGLTSRESLQAACNHRSADGTQDTLVLDPNTGIARCTICGYEFRPIESNESIESIKDASDRIIDILQTIKIMYTEIPEAAAREFFQIIPLIGKVPELFQYAAKNFSKHEYNAWQYQNHNMSGINMFQNLNNMFAGGTNFQPQFNAYAAQPGAPVGYPTGAPMGQQMNPFGYGAPAAGYAPQTQGFAYSPAAPVAAPAAPAVEAAPTETVTQTVNV